MKSGVFKVLGTATLLLAAAMLSGYAYTQSNSFRESIASTLSAVLGESVELGDDLAINSVYPRIKITLPNAKVRASGVSAGLNRARLQNLQATLGYRVLFSGGANGEIQFKSDNLTIITQSGQSILAPTDETANTTGFDKFVRFLTDQLAPIQQAVAGLKIDITISKLDYIHRDRLTGNTAYSLANVEINSRSGNTLQASANVLEADDIIQTFTLQLQGAKSRQQHETGAWTGSLNIDLSNVAEHTATQHFQGNWTLQENVLDINALEYGSGALLLRGNATIRYSTQEIGMESDLEIRRWDIRTDQSTTPTSEKKSPPPRLFSYDIFDIEVPKQIKADVKLHLGAVRLDDMPLVNGELLFQLREGTLDVSSENFTLLGGKTDLSLQLDNSLAHFMGLNLKLDADDIQLNRIKSSDNNETMLSRGKADMIIALRGAGPSPGHIASTLDGYLIATINGARVKQKYSTLLDVGVVNWAVDNLSLLTKEGDAKRNSAILSDPLTVECASLRLYINDGIVEASNAAIVEFQDNMLFSSGYIDLKNETIGFAFRTKKRSIFDWSAVSIAKYAEIGGYLGRPAITLNTQELAKQGVLTASTVVWGPLPSLVYSLAESGVRNMKSDQCTPEID